MLSAFRLFLIAGLLALLPLSSFSSTDISSSANSVITAQQFGNMPLAFTINQDQWDDEVKFQADVGEATMWFSSDGAYNQFTRSLLNDEPQAGLVDPVDLDGDGYTDDVDCNDADPAIYPGAPEIPDDDIDQDCNGFDAITCFVDDDQDGYGSATEVIADDGSCDAAQQESDNSSDCNDVVASINPGATEIPDDDIDQDCNGADAITCFVDDDQDGYGTNTTVIADDGSCDTAQQESDNSSDCNDAVASINPGATEIPDDGIDQDCNGADAITCIVDADHDGYGTEVGTVVIAEDGICNTSQGESYNTNDCNDAMASIYPGATEIPDDDIDQDCNGADAITCFVDADQDGYGTNTTVIADDGMCNTSQGESDNMADCVDTDENVNPGATEVLDDGIDQDCNGFDAITCFVDADQDGYGTDAGTVVIADDGSCDIAQQESTNDIDCNDAMASIYPGATEIPDDDIDQDCNGADAITCIVDADHDGYGTEVGTVVIAEDGSCDIAQQESTNDIDCNDADPAINPDATDIPDDGIDQNCDGVDATCCGLYTLGQTGNTDCSDDGKRNLADITRLIDRVYVSKVELCCEPNGNVEGDELDKINLADITALIDHVYVSKEETAACDTQNPTPVGTIISHTGCKDESLGKAVNDFTTDQDCMVWQYDGNSELLINHINAGFNCCPVILADINVENLTITITEIDSLDNGGCFCLCLFDVNYKITNLPPGQYRVVFEEPYKIESDPVLDITIDLISSPSGDHCVSRTQYPWGQ